MTELFNTFFETIGSTSAFEAVRTAKKINVNKLASDLKFAKFSDLGTPVIDYVELTLNKDLVNTGNNEAFRSTSKIANNIGKGLSNQILQHGININTFHMNDVEVVVNRTANIVRTSINGVDGTFKEFFNNGDFIITLTGSLAGLTMYQNDLQNLNNFARIMLANESFNIKSSFVNDTFNVTEVIMSDFSMSLNKEYNNVVDFTISLESDEDIEIDYGSSITI